MAYTNGIFHINLETGSDAARTALTSCTASNPSGTITRINKTSHGLVTGAIVDLTLFSSWLNDAWKITVVDSNNFDLDSAVWQTTADNSGTATPRGGSSWSDAWLTTSSGATAARVQPGDEFRVAKTADPVSLGQSATWTNNSATVTLTTAVTKKIEDATANDWTVSANITGGTNTSRKIGSNALTLAPASAFTTGKVAYKAISGGGTQDFSSYSRISFWMRCATAGSIAANTYKICLCSDTTGDTIVNEINIPALGNASSTGWQIIDLDYGGALSSSVQSVALYANSDPGTVTVSLNNIFATSSLSIKHLIGKSGEVFYRIQSIDGTTIKLDSNSTAVTSQGYSGTTESVTTYYRDGLQTNTAVTYFSMNESGSALNQKNKLTGGWNTSSGLQDGYTTIIFSPSAGTMFGGTFNYHAFENFISAGQAALTSSGNVMDFTNVIATGGSNTFNFTGGAQMLLSNCKILNNSGTTAAYSGAYTEYKDCWFKNNTTFGVTTGPNNTFIGCTFSNNGTSAISVTSPTNGSHGSILLRNCSISESTEFSFSTSQNGTVWSYDHDATAGNHWGFFFGGTINWQTGTVHGSEPGAWKFAHTSNTRGVGLPVEMTVAEIACSANNLVTVKAWVKKDHATNVAASIFVKDAAYNITGVSASTATKASDTSWEELTLTFTPTIAGIVPVLFSTWYVAGLSNVYLGSITVTQA